MDNSENSYKQQRLNKLRDMETEGISPFPHNYHRSHTIAQVIHEYGNATAHELSSGSVKTAGRIDAVREQGGVIFMDIVDQSGRIQLCIRRDQVPEVHSLARNYTTVGTIIGVGGGIFRTKSNQLTIMTEFVQLLSHCLHPLPDKRHGIKDVAIARDARYVELIVSAEARARFAMRSQATRVIRQFLYDRNFMEVETPVLDVVYGGAEARPFLTRSNAFDQLLYLRISPELSLKRLLVGGYERVFEIGHQFRNEGVDHSHHPEFTTVEIYQILADYNDMMDLTEAIISHVAREVVGSTLMIKEEDDKVVTIGLEPPFQRLTYFGAIEKYTGYDLEYASDEKAREVAKVLGVTPKNEKEVDDRTKDEVAQHIFDALVEDHLVQPTFIIDYPASICPLTKRHRTYPHLAERFELFIGGTEYANAYSELNDPREQQAHFEQQENNRRLRGDELAHPTDLDFVRALEYGMPPAGGLGIGIDRLVMLLTGARNIRDVILFPLRRA